MTTLAIGDAVKLVRKNLDEVDVNGSAMYGTGNNVNDNTSLDMTIKRSLPEAINQIHLMAPVEQLDWEDELATGITSCSVDSDTKKVMTFTLPSGSKFLRLVSFQAKDSDIVVTDVIPQASAEGRKQANKYIRGTYDRPRLVMEQGSSSTKTPTFHYYSLKEAYTGSGGSILVGAKINFLRFIKEQEFDSTLSDNAGYNISYRVRQNIIDYLTGLVMMIFNDQRAEAFFKKASTFHI